MKKLFIIVSAGALVLAAACGSGDDTQPPPTATFPPDFTPLPSELLTPGPPPTLTADEAEFVEYASPNLPYTLSLPKGFTTEGNDRFQYSTPAKGLVAEIVVNCTRPGVLSGEGGGTGPVDPAAMTREDAQLLEGSEAPFSSGEAIELTLDGKPAVRWDYLVALAGGASRVNQRVWYVGDDPCGWRLRTVIYGLEPFDSWREMFDEVAESFRADASQINIGGESG